VARADVLVFATGADRTEALGDRADLRDKSVLVPNGVDRERFRPADRTAARRALGLPEGACAVGFVGRHAPEKNLGALLDAVERVPGLELWIAGRGPETEALRARAGDRVRFLGFLSAEDLPRFHAALDGLALASFHEGLPTVILEAWASGRPVIVPAVTGLADLLADGGGLLAERPDADALAAALRTFRERMAGGVPDDWCPGTLRERSRPYGWDRVTEAMLAVYATAAERRCAS
jgi:glycosyltransferase involved in cell wall biosynthesis